MTCIRSINGWLWALLLCGLCIGAAPAARNRATGPSRATLAALPTEAELNRLSQLAPSYADHCRKYELWVHPYQELSAQVLLRLTAEPETWNEADFNARLDGELRLARAAALMPPPRGERRPYLHLMETPWRVFVASAPTPEALKARIATLERFYQDRRALRFGLNYEDVNAITQAIEMYFHRNVDKYPTIASRANLFDGLFPPPDDAAARDPFQYFRQQMNRAFQAEVKDRALAAGRIARMNPPPKAFKTPRRKVEVAKGLSEKSRAAQPAKRPEVSDATRKALPTDEEIRALAAMPDAADSNSPEYRTRQERYRKLVDRLDDDAATWTTSDFAARAVGFDRAYKAMYNTRIRDDDPAVSAPAINNIWRDWAVSAPSREEFRNRLAVIECQRGLAEYPYQKRQIDQSIEQAVRAYFNQNKDAYKEVDAQLDFLDYLRSQAVVSAAMDEAAEWVVWARGPMAF